MVMHVYHLIPSLSYGGLEEAVRGLALGQIRSGHSVTIGCWSRGGNHPEVEDDLERAGVSIAYLRRAPDGGVLNGRMSLFRILKAHLAARKPDLLHIHNPLEHYPFGVLTARVVGQIAIVNTLHGTSMFDHWSFGRNARVKFWLSALLSDRVVSVCPEVERFVRSKYVLPRKKLSVVENGIDLSRFLAVPARDSRRQLVFGTVARMGPEKNHRLLIESFALAHHTYGEIRLRLLGSGPLEPELRSLVRELGLNDVVEFCGFSHDVAGFLGSLDIFALSSNTEGQPLSLIEAIASGLPVVATDVGGVRDVVQNTRSGWLCPPDNTDAFLAAMQSAITCSERREQAERARQLAAERYSAERMARDYEQLYQELL